MMKWLKIHTQNCVLLTGMYYSYWLWIVFSLTCRGHFLAEEHKIDLVKGDVLQGFVGVGDVGPDPGLGPVQEAPVRQRGGAGGGLGLNQLITNLPETLNSPANHTKVSGAVVLRTKDIFTKISMIKWKYTRLTCDKVWVK